MNFISYTYERFLNFLSPRRENEKIDLITAIKSFKPYKKIRYLMILDNNELRQILINVLQELTSSEMNDHITNTNLALKGIIISYILKNKWSNRQILHGMCFTAQRLLLIQKIRRHYLISFISIEDFLNLENKDDDELIGIMEALDKYEFSLASLFFIGFSYVAYRIYKGK